MRFHDPVDDYRDTDFYGIGPDDFHICKCRGKIAGADVYCVIKNCSYQQQVKGNGMPAVVKSHTGEVLSGGDKDHTRNDHFTRTAFRVGTKAERGKDIPILLYDLLKIGTPHPKEERIRNIITSYLTKHGHKPGLDKKGNIWCSNPYR